MCVVQEFESRGCKVIPMFASSLDFSVCFNEYIFSAGQCLVDGVVSLTGFALVGGPTRQDNPKAVETLA